MEKIKSLLMEMYRDDAVEKAFSQLEVIIETRQKNFKVPSNVPKNGLPLDETDAIMITYGDQFQKDGTAPLENLHNFMTEYAGEFVKGVHILPFSPYSSDDGFSVIDYRQVHPDWGNWNHIEAIGNDSRLMADLVLNHCSKESNWFKEFKNGHEKYSNYFITVEEGTDVSSVFRPRALPLLHEFETVDGKKLVWTTFSEDQVDLNFSNPDVLCEMIDILLLYVEKGAQIIRLDAIAYLWKELGTPCLHHKNTHNAVKLMRAIFDKVCPWVVIITETNVPHEENISYFGDGTDEAHMVYQFSLPPLTLDAFLRKDAGHLREWAKTLDTYNGKITYFNFLASHDGVGVLPARGILSTEEVDGLIKSVEEKGGRVSYKATPQGDVPYEMNINYLSAVTDENSPAEVRAAKFLASQAVMLSLIGVPGIYVHSLVGSENWAAGIAQTGMNRTINREKLNYDDVVAQLDTPGTLRNRVFEGFSAMLKARRNSSAFDPKGEQHILDLRGSAFGVLRTSRDGLEKVLCLINVSHEPVECVFGQELLGSGQEKVLYDIISGDAVVPHLSNGKFSLELDAYEVTWLRHETLES